MPPLSIPAEPEAPKRRSKPSASGADLWVRVLIPAAVALVFIAVLLGETAMTAFDLQIVAPRSAQTGEVIPLRSWLFDLRASVPSLVAEPVEVYVREVDGERMTESVRLHPSAFGAEGSIALPDRTGQLELVAEARVGEERAFVTRRITVGEVEQSPRIGRLQTDLQRYALSAVVGSAPPSQLDARVVGGDCSPPFPCEIWVWIGEPAASLRLDEARGVDDHFCEPHQPTSGLIRCELTASNNEAQVDLVALRDEVEVGRRTLTLPLGLAAPRLDVRPRAPADSRIQITVERRYDEEGPVLVDLFYEGRWHSTHTVDQSMELAIPSGGIWRAQARTDPFGIDHASTRLFASSDDLGAIASHAQRIDDPFARWLRDGRAVDPERAASFVFALEELELRVLPRATSGAAQVNAGLHDVFASRRIAAALSIALAGIFVAIVVYRRGARASLQAQSLLAVEGESLPPRRLGGVIGAAIFVIAVFSAVAILVVSRGCL